MQSGEEKVFLSVDLGATSGRVMAGVWSPTHGKLSLETVNRFPTQTINEPDGMHWDMPTIFNSIKEGLKIAAKIYGSRITSIGVDSWGVDYALMDKTGGMLNNPYHYRDSRTDGMQDAVQSIVSKETIYRETGIQFLFFNTIYQLYSETRFRKDSLSRASKLLFVPDLIGYWLTGNAYQERTIASTSQLLNPISGTWSEKLITALSLPNDLFSPVVEPGTKVGNATKEIQKETKLDEIPVIAVAGHDTASAFVALPGNRKDYAIMNSGTWSLMGLELTEPQISTNALADGFSNEIGYDKTVRFLKNISGMWLLEECRRHWSGAGRTYNYEQIAAMAGSAIPWRSLIDPDSPEFAAPASMPHSIAEYCRKTKQHVPDNDAAFIRCIFDSLVLKYRHVFNRLESYSPLPLCGLYMLGGGVRNKLLNQMTADTLGVEVVTGPAEATAIGNILVQMISNGILSSLDVARELIGVSFLSETFQPGDRLPLNEATERFNTLLKND
jgi:rhamnulokinase